MAKSTARRGVSLHLGLNGVDRRHYQGWDGALQGCENDARAMAAIASASGFDATTLLTKEATADATMTAIEAAATALGMGDFFLLTFAGAGGELPDLNGDEPDQIDETWALYDRQLVNDELFAAWARFAPGVNILVVSDSGYHGSAVRQTIDALRPDILDTVGAAVQMRSIPRQVAHEVYETNRAQYNAIQEQVPDRDKIELAVNFLHLNACMDNQAARDGVENGEFTRVLLDVWNDGRFQGGYRKFHRDILARMPPWQSPYFYASAKSGAFSRRRPFTI